jgi:uncharacterized protein YbaR (Trm112 family)
MEKIIVICPECKTELIIDKETGAILLSTKPKVQESHSLEERLKAIKEEKSKAEDIFQKEIQTLKEKERLLEEKFKEALKKAKEEKEK